MFDPKTLQDDSASAAHAVEASVAEPARSEAGALIGWSCFNLRAAQIGLRIAQSSGADPRGVLAHELGEEADMLHIAALSLGFGDIASSLDICAGAIGVLSNFRPPAPRVPDVDWWSPLRIGQLRIPEFVAWLVTVQQDARWQVVTHFRHPITHRFVARHIRVGGDSPYSLALNMPNGVEREVVDVLDELLDFAAAGLRDFYAAVRQVYP